MFSSDYFGSIKQDKKFDYAIERAFKEQRNACVPILFITEQTSYHEIEVHFFSKYVIDDLRTVSDFYTAQCL